MTTIREAVLRAADSIEQNPHLFDFGSLAVPDNDCGIPGCALGWIAYHADIPLDQDHRVSTTSNSGTGGVYWGQDNAVYDFLGVPYHCGFELLDEFVDNWTWDANRCAKALRLYADKYHPATGQQTGHKGIPDNVLSIFNEELAA